MQLAVLAGNFLLSRACITLASLKNNEVGQYLFYVLIYHKDVQDVDTKKNNLDSRRSNKFDKFI